jgi:hypothetical protein
MRRIRLALSASIMLLLAACQTGKIDYYAGPSGGSGLPSANFANVVPVAGVRYVALDARGDELVASTVGVALLNPGTVSFARPFVGAEVDNTVLVCGSVSAAVGATRYDNVPFVIVIDYDRVNVTGPVRSDAASLEQLGANVGFAGGYSKSNDSIIAFCRDEAGVILPRP